MARVMVAWDSLKADRIKHSFKLWDLTKAPGGSQDNKVFCFQEGKDCAAGGQRLEDKVANGSVPIQVIDDRDKDMEELRMVFDCGTVPSEGRRSDKRLPGSPDFILCDSGTEIQCPNQWKNFTTGVLPVKWCSATGCMFSRFYPASTSYRNYIWSNISHLAVRVAA